MTKKIYINNNTNALIIVNYNNSFEYENFNFTFLFEGTKKEALLFIDEYWEENFFEEESKILIEA